MRRVNRKWGHSSIPSKRGQTCRGCGGGGVRGGLRAKRGRCRLAERLPTADSLCSLKVARASKISADGNFRRSLVGSLRALTSAEMVAPGCIAAARMGFLLAALHSVAKRVSRGQAYHPTRFRPRWPEDRPARLRRHDPQLRSPWVEPSRQVPRVEKIARLGGSGSGCDLEA